MMKINNILSILLSLPLVCAACGNPQREAFHHLDDVDVPLGVPSQIKEYEGFTVSYNADRHAPNYVAWELLADETGGASARSNNFWTDDDIYGCANTKDYTNSGYDRGHMCPAADQKWSSTAMHHSFVMANICPQDHQLNTGAWNTLENKERQWAQRDSLLVIVAGPIYDDSSRQTIGNGDIDIPVPSAFFKVLLAPLASPMRAIGFVYPNMKCPGNMANYSCTVDEVERITGYDFFHNLPDEIEQQVESSASFKEWNKRN